jgi:hypothetical protein
METNKHGYLLAQLTDPQWVDQRVQQVHGGKFANQVDETAAKLANDRASVKQLERFAKEGVWDATDTAASATLKDVQGRQVHMKKIGTRWYLESRQTPAAAEK